MSETVSIDLSSISKMGSGRAADGSGPKSEIEALRKQLADLQKKLGKIVTDPDKAKGNAKVIQQQIQIISARIAQLETQGAKKTTESVQPPALQRSDRSDAAAKKGEISVRTDSAKGSKVDEYV